MAPICEPLCHFGDRLYFTTFPAPAPLPHVLNRDSNEDAQNPRLRSHTQNAPPTTPDDGAAYYYFTIDHQLIYLSFFKDWGPLNLAMVYKACIFIHELIEDEELSTRRLVLFSSNDPRRKANAALLMALYSMIVMKKAPWEAFQPVAELEFMPFRDAGRGHSDFNLSIQDCLWGMWKAMQHGLLDMNEFNVEDYEFYEKVENGDWNWITPGFIAFASPVESQWPKKVAMGRVGETSSSPAGPQRGSGCGSSPDTALQRKLPSPFINCLDYFEARGVKLVVRLNNMLYDKQHFLERNIRHEELYFDDGTNPTDDIVRKFINLSDEVIEDGGAIAVHCKAGLGRTGTLIGAYLIWKYGFTAHEAIAFMRIVRPGSVVGPQQQYMYVKQLEWAKWAAVDEMRKAEASVASSTVVSSIVTPATPPADDEAMDITEAVGTSTPKGKVYIPPVTPSKHVTAATARARQIAPPGQPRKTPVMKRTADIAAVDEDEDEVEDELGLLPALQTAGAARGRLRSTPQGKLASGRTTGRIRVPPASDQRPARITRSTVAGSRRLPITNAKETTGRAVGNISSPNKIPRLAHTQTAPVGPPGSSSNEEHKLHTARSATSMSTRSQQQNVRATSPTPSRLPTLVSGRRANASGATGTTAIAPTTKASEVNAGALKKNASAATLNASNDAWMKANANAVVIPGSKSGRPGLRSVRRRRSSFSNAEVALT